MYRTGNEVDLSDSKSREIKRRLQRDLAALLPDLADSEYVTGHLRRYVYTLKLLDRFVDDGTSALTILDLGTSLPYPFQVGLHRLRPGTRFVVVQEQLYDGLSYRRFVNESERIDFDLSVHAFNIEKDRWTFAADSFDVIICTEVLEHLVLDPLFVFREAWRCLRPNGLFCVTTPNVLCYESFYGILEGLTPYTFGQYQPQYGVYGHHNREYTPSEVEALGNSSGLDTQLLTTKDVYDPRFDIGHAIELARSLGKDQNRGHVIFYVGSKGEKRPSGFPKELYLEDPTSGE